MIESLIEKLNGSKFASLEITPSHGASISQLLDGILALKQREKLAGYTITDNPLAKLKYSAAIASIKAQEVLRQPIICTLSMRDKNKLALQSELLGLNDFDVRAFLALTGDPARMSDQPNVKGVFECDSTQLLSMIRFFNAGVDFAGKMFKQPPKPIYPFAVSNSYAKNFDHIAKKLHKKIENGAVGIITQPVFDAKIARELLKVFNDVAMSFDDERRNCKLIFGIFPITSLKTAQFLRAHVPGIFVPTQWVDKLLLASKESPEREQQVGLEMTIELLQDVFAINPRVHIMTANKFNSVDLLLNEIF